jgi:hypothetical protein
LITETATFTCSICGEPSTEICLSCTKDSCRNHRCERCKRCSDCCECEIPLSAAEPEAVKPPEEHVIEEVPAPAPEPVPEASVEAGHVDTAAGEALPHFHDPIPPSHEPEPEA